MLQNNLFKSISVVLLAILNSQTVFAQNTTLSTRVSPGTDRGGVHQFSVALARSGAYQIDLSRVGRKQKYDMVLDTQEAMGIGIGYEYMTAKKIGLASQLTFENQREIEKISVLGQGSADVGNQNRPTFTMVTLQTNLTYHIQSVYPFAGLNYSEIDYRSAKNDDVSDMTSDIGYQLGAGVKVLKSLAIEAEYRVQKIKLEVSSRDTYEGQMVSGVVSAKYLF